MSSSSSTKLIEGDLVALAAETSRCLPAVKEAAERALLELRSPSKLAPESLKAHCLAPLLIACNHSDAPKKVLFLSLGALQRLVTSDGVAPRDLASIARVLEIQVRKPKRAARRITPRRRP